MKFCKRSPRTSKCKARGKVFNKSGSNFPCPCPPPPPSSLFYPPRHDKLHGDQLTSGKPDRLGGPSSGGEQEADSHKWATPITEGWVTCPSTRGYCRGKGGKPGEGPESRKRKSMLWKLDSGSLCLKRDELRAVLESERAWSQADWEAVGHSG